MNNTGNATTALGRSLNAGEQAQTFTLDEKGTFAVSDDGSSPDPRYNAGTVVYKSTAVQGRAKSKKL